MRDVGHCRVRIITGHLGGGAQIAVGFERGPISQQPRVMSLVALMESIPCSCRGSVVILEP